MQSHHIDDEKRNILCIFEERKFELVVPKFVDGFVCGFSNYIFENASEESILEFFKYMEKNTLFQPIKFYGHNEQSKSRLLHSNYNNKHCNPSHVIHNIIMAQRFDIADKLLVGDYKMDDEYLRMLIIIVCDDITLGNDVGVEYERKMANWMVKKNYVVWETLPNHLHPNYKGTFTKITIDRLHSNDDDDEFRDIPLIP